MVAGALAPLTRMTGLAGRIAAGNRGERLRPSRPGTDLGRTAVAFDGMLDALEAQELRMRSFLADTSHDLRTPVAGVIATADSLLQDENITRAGPSGSAGWWRWCARPGGPAGWWARPAADGPPRRHRPGRGAAPPAGRPDRAGQDVAAAQRQLGADVQVRADGPAPVTGDPEQLARVLTNLADNARRGAQHVLLSVRREVTQVTVEVTDDGPGVPSAKRDRVFERFVRLDAGPGGNGLGLPIARAVARAHQGELTCENPPAGARFVLRVPAEEKVPAGNIG